MGTSDSSSSLSSKERCRYPIPLAATQRRHHERYCTCPVASCSSFSSCVGSIGAGKSLAAASSSLSSCTSLSSPPPLSLYLRLFPLLALFLSFSLSVSPPLLSIHLSLHPSLFRHLSCISFCLWLLLSPTPLSVLTPAGLEGRVRTCAASAEDAIIAFPYSPNN